MLLVFEIRLGDDFRTFLVYCNDLSQSLLTEKSILNFALLSLPLAYD